jgi:hypothetical protein
MNFVKVIDVLAIYGLTLFGKNHPDTAPEPFLAFPAL